MKIFWNANQENNYYKTNSCTDITLEYPLIFISPAFSTTRNIENAEADMRILNRINAKIVHN